MPKTKPSTSGYARIAQAEEDDDDLSVDSATEDPYRAPSTLSSRQYEAIQPKSSSWRMPPGRSASFNSQWRTSGERRRPRSNSGVDIKAINARLERWAEEIASKFKIRRIKGKTEAEEQLEIHHSVFQAPEGIRPISAEALSTYEQQPSSVERVSKVEFDELVESVRVAIENNVHPTLISQGSSGSYFARTPDGKIVGVFKPKDEEPYATRNPKWTKWIHRNLFPFFFGRACLIPNLSYVSEAAASVLDTQLRTDLVPYTGVVSLASRSFFYDFWDRRAYRRKRKPFPEKLGSFQVFLKGYKDANLFLKEHPWPDQHSITARNTATNKRRRRGWAADCRPGGAQSDDEEESLQSNSTADTLRTHEFWSEELKQSFKEQLERLVILDYIMRNTDRGLDNWMIKIDRATNSAKIVAEAPKSAQNGSADTTLGVPEDEPYRRREETMAASRSTTSRNTKTRETVSIGAIDNSLSWPWKHPDAWRSYPFGWLFLPVSLIGQPFSEATRQHFLPLLTSKDWWTETQLALRHCFSQDADFKERMFARQMAVMKGQAWNVVETLKTKDHGPLELTRRTRVFVWDDLVDVPVVMPLRSPSTEMRRRQTEQTEAEAQDEMDISAALPSASLTQHDLLGISSPQSDFGVTNPFNVSRQAHRTGPRESDESIRSTLSTETARRVVNSASPESITRNSQSVTLGAQPRPSLDESRRSNKPRRHRRRHFSFSVRQNHLPNPFSDEDDGDLGYAAAEDLERNTKKVIVERLETVKGKNPFFTWC